MGITAIILAGGKSRRMGFDKTHIEIFGDNIIKRLVTEITPIVDQIIIADNAAGTLNNVDHRFGENNIEYVADIFPGYGPLGGIHAGLTYATNNVCLVIAGDMPFVKKEIVEFLLKHHNGYDAAIVQEDGYYHCLLGVYNKSCLPHIEAMFQTGSASVSDLYLRVNIKTLDINDLPDQWHQAFFNINTKRDYAKAAGGNIAFRQQNDLESVWKLLFELGQPLPSQSIDLLGTIGKVLSDSVYACEQYPLNNQSRVDGFAVNSRDLKKHDGVLSLELPLGLGGTELVATGDVLSEACDMVLPVEAVTVRKKQLTYNLAQYKCSNIFYAGHEIVAGQLLAERGNLVTHQLAAFLALSGNEEIRVHKIPEVAIIVIGDDLVEVGKWKEAGKIPATNGVMLQGLLTRLGVMCFKPVVVPAQVDSLCNALKDAVNNSDFIITTGGTGKGKSDIISEAFAMLGWNMLVNGIKVRPGTGVWIWHLGEKVCMCLPGIAGAAAVNFHLLAAPFIRKLQGFIEYQPDFIDLPLSQGYTKRHIMREIVNAKIDLIDNSLFFTPLDHADGMFGLMDKYNALLDIPAGKKRFEAGEWVRGYILNDK